MKLKRVWGRLSFILPDRLDVDLRGQKPLLVEEIRDRVLDALDLVGAVVGIRQDGLVLLFELVGDVLFLDLPAGLVRDGADDGVLRDDDPDDLAPRPLALLELDVREEPGRPEDLEVPAELVDVVEVPLADGQVIHDRLGRHALVADDLDLLHDVLGGQDGRQSQKSEDEEGLLHGRHLSIYIITSGDGQRRGRPGGDRRPPHQS
jgi:hypothetical protein